MGDKPRRDGEDYVAFFCTPGEGEVRTPLRQRDDVHLGGHDSEAGTAPKPRDGCRVKVQEAPDGGWGWVVVAASTLMFLIISSMLNSFSVLYGAYKDHFDQSVGAIGLIIAVKLFCLHFTGNDVDRGGFLRFQFFMSLLIVEIIFMIYTIIT